MRPMTLIPLALLGLSTMAFGQELDETTLDLGIEAEQAAEQAGKTKRNRGNARNSRGNSRGARGNPTRGGQRGAPAARGGQRGAPPARGQNQGQWRSNGQVSEGMRQNGDTRQMTRTNGDRSMTRTIHQDGNQTRMRTEGISQQNGVTKLRRQSQITNGNKSVRWGEGENRFRDAVRGDSYTNRRTSQTVANGQGGRHHQQTRDTLAVKRGPNGQKTLESRVRTHSSTSGHKHGVPQTPHARPGHSRPGTHAGPNRPSGHARPGTHVTPHRPGHRGPTRVVVGHARPHVTHVRYTHVRPYHGVFVYGPPPVTHNHYHSRPAMAPNGQVKVKKSDLPQRFVDRDNSFAIGLKGGSMWSGYFDANAYADAGVGINARYRPDEAIGLDVAIQHHDQTWSPNSERSQTMMSGSVELFAYPWTRVSPYVIGGLTYTSRDIEDEIFQTDRVNLIETGQPLIGPHAGLGVEFALGKTVALDLEARYTGYLNRKPTDASLPGALTTTAGLMFHF